MLVALRHVYVPLVLGGPLLMALGAAVVVSSVGESAEIPLRRYFAAAALSVAILLVVTVMAQGTHLLGAVAGYIAAGALGSFLVLRQRTWEHRHTPQTPPEF